MMSCVCVCVMTYVFCGFLHGRETVQEHLRAKKHKRLIDETRGVGFSRMLFAGNHILYKTGIDSAISSVLF